MEVCRRSSAALSQISPVGRRRSLVVNGRALSSSFGALEVVSSTMSCPTSSAEAWLPSEGVLPTLGLDEDVLQLEVPVHHALPVEVAEAVDELALDVGSLPLHQLRGLPRHQDLGCGGRPGQPVEMPSGSAAQRWRRRWPGASAAVGSAAARRIGSPAWRLGGCLRLGPSQAAAKRRPGRPGGRSCSAAAAARLWRAHRLGGGSGLKWPRPTRLGARGVDRRQWLGASRRVVTRLPFGAGPAVGAGHGLR